MGMNWCLASLNPVCGDRITLDLQHHQKNIYIGMEVRGCLICKASAVLLKKHCCGKTEQAIRQFSETLQQTLSTAQEDEFPRSLTGNLSILLPLAQHKHRHSCAMLPLKTLLDAIGTEQ